jgi:acetyl esterase
VDVRADLPLDPQFKAILAALPPFPDIRTLQIPQLRKIVHQSSTTAPPLPVALGSINDRTIPGPGGALPVRIYTPTGNGPFPIIVYFHGGGWVVCDLDTHDMIARGLSHASGAILISVDYRLAPEHRFPAAIDDAWAAVRWASQHAIELGGHPKLLAVAGDSAGGVIASAIALRARDEKGPELAAQVNFYGSCNYPSQLTASARAFAEGPLLSKTDIDYFWSLYLSDPARDQHHPWASPIRAASLAGLPPAFVATAEIDPSRDDTEAFAAKLAAAGTSVTQRRYPGMVHGFLSFLGTIDGAQRAVDECSAWLKQQFARAPA